MTNASLLPTIDKGKPKQISHYFAEAALLRTCLAYNDDDHIFASEAGGRIIYIFDANIVAFFLQPEHENERRKILAFGSDERAYGYASATALITAEFLFSRRLAGQHDNPALISPAHGDDLADIMDRIQRDLAGEERNLATEENISQIEAMLDIVLDRIRNRDYDNIGQVAEELRKFVPRLADELENRLAPLQQLCRIYEQDLLRPLALHTAVTLDVLQPSKNEIQKWSDRITIERKKRKKARPRLNSQRDATALVQTMMLDEAAAENSEPTRYVLVTADMALFDAYATWYWELHEEMRPRFVIRLPLQYVPILNTLDMPNSLRSDEVTKKAFLALDSLFGNLRQVEPHYERKLAYYRLLEADLGARRDAITDYFGGVDPLEIGLEAFDNARSEWNACYLNGTVLNAPLMYRRHAEAFEGLVHALRESSELRDAFEKAQVSSLERIVDAHAKFTTRVTAADILSELRNDSEQVVPPHRIPFLLRLEGCGFPESVVDLLTATSPLDANAVKQDLQTIVAEVQSDKSLLLAGVIAFRRGHWLGAQAFARQGLSTATSSHIKLELNYLIAATNRYIINAMQPADILSALGDAEIALSDSIQKGLQAEDHFATLRAKIEHQALILTICRLKLHAKPSICLLLDNYECNLLSVLKTSQILGVAADDLDCTPELAAALSAHTQRIGLGAAIQIHLFGNRGDGESLDSVDMVDVVRKMRPPNPPSWADLPIHQAHRLIGGWIEGQGEIEKVEKGLAALIEESLSENWMSTLDRQEIERCIAQLRVITDADH